MSSATGGAAANAEFETFAREKLSRVLGPAAAGRIFTETLSAAGLAALSSPDDLYRFGEQLSRRGGFEAAVGGLLTVAAVLRGASARSR